MIEDTTVQKCQPKSQLLFSNRHYQCTCSSMYCINFAVYDLSLRSLTSCSCFFDVYSFFLLKRKGTFHFLFFLFSSCGILKLKEKKKLKLREERALSMKMDCGVSAREEPNSSTKIEAEKVSMPSSSKESHVNADNPADSRFASN